MAEWSIASDLKSDELNRFREFESHSFLLTITFSKDVVFGKGFSFVLFRSGINNVRTIREIITF